jgi:uncharacterized protein YkwD
MKRQCHLKATPRRELVVFLGGLLGAATFACAIPDQTQTAPEPNALRPPKNEAQAAAGAAKRKFPTSGVWHHFSAKDSASVASQTPPAVWHSFGLSHGTSNVGPEAPVPQRSVGANRMADLERQMLVLINQDRLRPETFAETGGRAQPLKWNDSLAAVARAHSMDMLEQRFFSHVDPDGTTFSLRINEAGIPWQEAGENIAIYETTSGAEAAFMNEPRFQHNHRANILNPSYTDVGIGIVKGRDGGLYITQDFVAAPPTRSAR